MIEILRALKQRYKDDARKISELVPAEAQTLLEAVLKTPNLLPPALVNEIAKQEAMEHLISDVLSDAIKEFTNKVNPLTLDIGLPSMVTKILSGMKAEFDRRVEPEIRRFMPVIARQALKRGAAFLLAHQDDAAFVAFRLKLMQWVLDQPVRELSPLLDDRTLEASAIIAEYIQRVAE